MAGRTGYETVVLVNGLWLPNAALALLAWRLRRAGFRTRSFSYPTRRNDLEENAARLHQFLVSVPGDTVHLLGFSLGGLVLQALFHFHPGQRPGRVLLLGSPLAGSRAAAALSCSSPGRWLIGRSLRDLLDSRSRDWGWPGRETGVIAGSRSLGLGRLVAHLPTPNDGTVAADETVLATARDRLLLAVTHFGLLLAPGVARQAGNFLRHGAFSR